MLSRYTLILTTILASASHADAADNYRNPVIDETLADPAVIFHDGMYYLYATGAVDGDNGYRVYTSKNLVGWERDDLANLREECVFGKLLVGCFGNTEINNLRHWTIVIERNQYIGRLEITVDDPLLVSVLHRVTYGNEQTQALLRGKTILIAERGNGNSLHQLHNEVRASAVGCTGI